MTVLEILKGTLQDYLNELHRCEAQKQLHLSNLRAYGSRQNELQQTIDELRKVIDEIEKKNGID